jgi:hypothetical protein
MNVFSAVRGGRGYASWGASGACPGSLAILADGTAKSCGGVNVPSLNDMSSVGRDGSLMVSEPPANFGTCVWDLYPQLLQ